MEIQITTLREIMSRKTMRMDAAYHIGKARGKQAFKQIAAGTFVKDDINGKIMSTETEVAEYNDAVVTIAALEEKKKKLNLKS